MSRVYTFVTRSALLTLGLGLGVSVLRCSGSCHFKPEHVPAIAHRTPTVAVDVDSHRSVSQLPSPARH
jgi:hypothetical protein